jgi:hypothetical protein
MPDRVDTIVTPHQRKQPGMCEHANERHRGISAGQRHIARSDTTDWDAGRTVQVRVSLWTWGFKSPLAHDLRRQA